MRKMSGADLAKEMNISPNVLGKTFDDYSACCRAGKDQYGKKFFANGPYELNDTFYTAFITPVVHYTMGGILVNN